MLVVETRPIFSVTATERSFVLGVIRLEKRVFAATLAQKAAGGRLPAELLALVEEDLFEHYWTRTTAKSWERMDAHWRNRHPGLYWERFMTGSALRTWCKLAVSVVQLQFFVNMAECKLSRPPGQPEPHSRGS